jgi:transcriptional regulator with XRE-family HTH domain
MTKLRVKELCKEKGLTLAVLAEQMGVSASAVTQYLKSDNISSATLVKFAEVLGVKLDDLVIREGCNINGFVDVDGQLFRINKKEDVDNLLEFIKQKENDRNNMR